MIAALFVLLLGALALLGVLLGARHLEALAWRRSLLAMDLRRPVGVSTEGYTRCLTTNAAAAAAPRLSLLPCPPVALEVAADVKGIRHLLLVPKQLRATVLSGLRAALPGVRLEEAPDYLKTRPHFTVAAEAVLTNQRRQMSVDRAEGVATALLATLQPLDEGETVVIQSIVTGAGTPPPVPSLAQQDELPAWPAGEELTDSEAIRSARLKAADAVLHAVLRIGVQGSSKAKASAIFHRVWGQHRGQNSPGVLLTRRLWLWPRWAGWRLSKLSVQITRWPLMLSTSEAPGLLPIPVGDVALPGLTLGLARQLPPPPGMPIAGVQIGVSTYPDMTPPLRLAPADRLQHLHVLGPTGVGKSTLLANLILQDIAAGHSVVVIDPKGDLCRDILVRLPEHRADDVVVLDPAATERPIGFNILQAAHDEQSRELVVDHVIHIWHELYEDFWGPRSEDVLRGALLSLINTKAANGEAFTLIETPELLTDKAFRQFVTTQAGVPAGLASFWRWYKGLKPYERFQIIGPILNKLRAATLRTPVRLMLGQSEGLHLERVLAERKILLVPLSAGTLGSETAGLLGTVLLAGIWFAILRRVILPAAQRHPVFVYVDEAQTVLKLPVDPDDMLARARGLGAGFILAHQHLGQIDDKLVRSALLGTVRNQIVFQCLREDAVTLAPSYAPYLKADDLMGLAAWEIAIRLSVAGQPLAPLTGVTLPLPLPIRDGAALAEGSRERFGRPRDEVEAALDARRSSTKVRDEAGTAASGTGKTFGRRRKPAKASDAKTNKANGDGQVGETTGGGRSGGSA